MKSNTVTTPKEAANYALGANVFPKELIDRFILGSKSIRERETATRLIKELRQDGWIVTSKQYSDFTAIAWAKEKIN